MSKIQYALTLSTFGKFPSPIPVCGWLKTYGHAEHEPSINAHVFRVSKEEWEDEMCRDMAENMRNHMGRWIVKAEVVHDLESAEGKLAQELDAVKAENADLLAKLEDAQTKLAALTPEPVKAEALGFAPEDAKEAAQLAAAEKLDEISAMLAPMGPEELEAEFKKANEAGANLVIEGRVTKVKLREALTEWLSKKE